MTEEINTKRVELSEEELEEVSGGLTRLQCRNMTPQLFLSLSEEEKKQYYNWVQKKKEKPLWISEFFR